MKQTDTEKLKQYILDTESRMANLSGTLSAIRYVTGNIEEHKDFPCIIALLDDYAEIILDEFQRIVDFDVDALAGEDKNEEKGIALLDAIEQINKNPIFSAINTLHADIINTWQNKPEKKALKCKRKAVYKWQLKQQNQNKCGLWTSVGSTA